MTKETPLITNFSNKIIMVGFGSIGQGVLPLLAKHFNVEKQVIIVNPDIEAKELADQYHVPYHQHTLTRQNYETILQPLLRPGDFLLNLSVNVSSHDLIQLSQEMGCLYLDTCIEPWEGGYLDSQSPLSEKTNYAFRENILSLRSRLSSNGPTAVIAHGANPGLISSFAKQAIVNVAKDVGCFDFMPKTKQEWAELAAKLNLKVIHIAEYDWQFSDIKKKAGEFVNTWSVDGFHSEGCQPAELGWGTHEKNWPKMARTHKYGCKAAIYLEQPSVKTTIKSWTPLAGQYKAFLITHNESISIADFLTLSDHKQNVTYRPTVHYSYRPCDDAILSLHELNGRDLVLQDEKRILGDDIIDGIDELGVLLMGHKKGAYWFGSTLSIHEARQLAPYNSSTTLQVTSAVLAGVLWAIENPNRGIVEAEELDFERILEIASPYLGTMSGHYTDWTPLLNEGIDSYLSTKDTSDPWQFINFALGEFI
jgi:homospermidine synthase